VWAGVLFALFPGALDQSSTLHRFVAGGDSGRWELWSGATRLLLEHPLLGLGPQHYAYYAGANGAHPHNAALQLASEWGTPAALAFLFLAVLGLRKLWTSLRATQDDCDPPEQGIRFALSASILAAAFHANLSGLLVMPLSQVGGCLVMAWMSAELRWQRSGETTARAAVARNMTEGDRLAGILGASLSLATLALLLLVGAPAVHQRLGEQIDLRAVDGLRYRPRIWRNGQTNFTITPAPEPTTNNDLHE
jgi:hypothetical protein